MVHAVPRLPQLLATSPLDKAKHNRHPIPSCLKLQADSWADYLARRQGEEAARKHLPPNSYRDQNFTLTVNNAGRGSLLRAQLPLVLDRRCAAVLRTEAAAQLGAVLAPAPAALRLAAALSILDAGDAVAADSYWCWWKIKGTRDQKGLSEIRGVRRSRRRWHADHDYIDTKRGSTLKLLHFCGHHGKFDTQTVPHSARF